MMEDQLQHTMLGFCLGVAPIATYAWSMESRFTRDNVLPSLAAALAVALVCWPILWAGWLT